MAIIKNILKLNDIVEHEDEDKVTYLLNIDGLGKIQGFHSIVGGKETFSLEFIKNYNLEPLFYFSKKQKDMTISLRKEIFQKVQNCLDKCYCENFLTIDEVSMVS